jgi:hypothetical protein
MIWYFCASQAVPNRRTMRIPMMTVRVRCAVRNCFDAGHGRAAVGECFHQQPNADELHRGRPEHGGMSNGMAAGLPDVEYSHADGNQQGADEEEGGDDEGRSRVLDASHVDQGEDGEHNQAKHQRVREKPLLAGYDVLDAGRDSDGGGEDVIDHQGGGCQQARTGSEIFRGDRVRTAAAGIGSNGLAVTEIDDDQQDQDRRDDGNDVLNAHQPKRDQQRKRCLRSIGRRSECVESKDWNSGGDTYVFGALFTCGQGAAK